MNARLKDQIAIVTGASRGLGKAIAAALAQAGARVALCARDAQALELAANEIRASGGTVLTQALDVADDASVARYVALVSATWGPVEILVNNAGMGYYKPFIEHSIAELDEIIATNLKGTLYFSRAVVETMIARKKGQILNVASDLARRPLANMAAYVASKHAVLGFSGSLARELKTHGIKVMALNSGIVDTSFGDSVAGSREETWSLRPEALAEVACFMLSQGPYVLMDEVTVHPLHQDF